VNRLRQLRESKGVSLRSLAKDMGISSAFLSDVERGFRNLTNERLADAAAILHCKPDDIRTVKPNHTMGCKDCGLSALEISKNHAEHCFVGKYIGR
jgi:transcriptional regulator with XRE-family HTH domain